MLLLQSVKLDVRAVPQGPLRVLLLQSVKLKDLLQALLLQSVKLKDLLQVLFLRPGNLKGYLDMSPVQSKCLPVLDVQYKSHLFVLLRQSLSLASCHGDPEPDGPPPSRVLLQNIEVNITVWGDSLCTTTTRTGSCHQRQELL